MITPEFIKNYSLYQKFETNLPPKIFTGGIDANDNMPAISKYCPKCKKDNTFMGILHLASHYKHMNQPGSSFRDANAIAGRIGLIESVCASCKDYYVFYLLYFDEDLKYVKKIGQFPPLSIDIEKNLANLLGKHGETYQKGLICETQGYGIGAYAYYRRIVENVIDDLLREIGKVISEEEKNEYEQKIKDLQFSHIAKDKIKLVKDLLPKSLSPDGLNPLGILHDTLSKGIHSMSEHECLEDAQEIRKSLIFLVGKIKLANDDKELEIQFKKNMAKLRNKHR